MRTTSVGATLTVAMLVLGGCAASAEEPVSRPGAGPVDGPVDPPVDAPVDAPVKAPAAAAPGAAAEGAARAVGPRTLERQVVLAPPQQLEPLVVLEAGLAPMPTLYGPGASSAEVREIQARLRQIGWFSGDVTDTYGPATTAAVAGFQTKREIPSTGEVDQRTLDRLEAMTTEPTSDELDNVEPEPEPEVATSQAAGLDPRCRTGRVLCIDKSTSSLRWVVEGDVQLTLDARFGGDGYTTREGSFSVFSKSRDHVSSLYESSMPFAMFFSGGQAVHYSPDFAATGYNGSSHGCVNIRAYSEMAWLYDQVALGDRVVVYWS